MTETEPPPWKRFEVIHVSGSELWPLTQRPRTPDQDDGPWAFLTSQAPHLLMLVWEAAAW